MQLLSNEAATGQPQRWVGGTGVFAVCGTFGGATVKLQFLGPDGATWVDVGTDTNLTAAGGAMFILPAVQIRAAVSGGAPSGLAASAEQVV
jgi:hypothetical protein